MIAYAASINWTTIERVNGTITVHYTSHEQNMFQFIFLQFLQPAPVLMYVHVHAQSVNVMACIMVRTDDIRTKGLKKKSSQGENVFPCKLASSLSPVL